MTDFVGALIAVPLGIWFWGAVFSSPYFWWKRVDRSLSPVARRVMALGYGLGWPYFLFNAFSQRRSSAAAAGPAAGPQAEGNPYRGSGASAPIQRPASEQDVKPSNPFR